MNEIAVHLLKEMLGDKIFSVKFIKRDGSLREMTARLGVKKGVTGIGMRYNPTEKGLLPVFDMQKKAYRMINLSTVKEIKFKGKVYTLINLFDGSNAVEVA